MREPLRVAVRVAADPAPAYIAHALERLGASPVAEVVLVLVDPSGAGRERTPGERRYDTVERLVYRGGLPALDPRPLPALGGVRPTAGAAGDPRRDAWALVEAARAEVLVDLAPAPLAPPARPAAPLPLGHWCLRFAGTAGGARGGTIPRRATREGVGEAVLEARLSGGESVDAERLVAALPAVGYARARDALLWAAAGFPARTLERTARRATAVAPDGAATRRSDGRAGVISVAPSAAALAPARPGAGAGDGSSGGHAGRPGWARLTVATARRILERAWYRETWEVLARRPAGPGLPPDLHGFRPIPPPAGRFLADPFVVAEASPPRTRLFVEVSRLGRHEGSIAALDLRRDGTWGPPGAALDLGRHLAYPHVARLGGRLVLTPDDAAGGVHAYEQAGDGTWRRVATLLEGVRASDPTLVEHDGRLWLFVAQAGPGMSPWDELHLYTAAAIEGPWAPHPANPVVADVRRARPAGRMLRIDGRLVRPGQDCALAYGRRIVLSEVDRLDEGGYAERVVGTIEPTGLRGATRTHTYGSDGDTEVLDAFVRRARLGLIAPSLPRLVRRRRPAVAAR